MEFKDQCSTKSRAPSSFVVQPSPPSPYCTTNKISSRPFTNSNYFTMDSNTISNSDQRLLVLGYRPEFRREMSLFGVLGMSFCAIGILTGMSSAFQTGLFSGGPLGLFWGWNVRSDTMNTTEDDRSIPYRRCAACSCSSSLLAWQRFVALSELVLDQTCASPDSAIIRQSNDGRFVLLGLQNETRHAISRM